MLTTRPSGPWSRCDQPCSASFAPPLDGRHHAHVGPPCPGHGPPLKRCRHLSSSRAPIPDVPAIYLVEPTPTNLQAITNDLQKGLYSSAHVNFLSSIPRPLLEDFAAQAAAAGTSEQIAQVFDQYLNFIVTEPDLFSLGMQKEHTYWALNSAKTKDEELDRVVDRIVSGLFSVVVTMGMIPPSSAVRDPKLTVIAGVIPVVSDKSRLGWERKSILTRRVKQIRCPRGAAAEMIAAKLDRKLRDHILNSKDNLFSSHARPSSSAAGTPTSRPVLVILDRNVDLVPMLSHSWTYQSLCFDVFKVRTYCDLEMPSKN